MKLKLSDFINDINLEKAMNLRDVNKWDSNDILDLFGLQRKNDAANWIIPGVGLFAVGVLCGVGIGMLFAPKEGKKLREDISNRVGESWQGAKDMVTDLPNRMGIGGEHEQSSRKHAAGSAASTSTASTGSAHRSSAPRNV